MAATGGPPTLISMTDIALAGLSPGRGVDGMVGSKLARQAVGATGTRQLADAPDPRSLTVPYEMLQERHPEWDIGYWEECRALYAGGKRLLGNPEIMKRLFPQNLHEPQNIY